MENFNNITRRLESLDEDYDSLKPFMKDYLEKVEEIISNIENEYRIAIDTLKDTRFTVSFVAKELDCSRTTLYNHNQLLIRYIEAAKIEFENCNPINQCEEQKKLNTELRRRINLMYERDIELENLKYEVKTLQSNIKEKNKDIKSLRNRIDDFLIENNRLKSEKGSENKMAPITQIISKK